MGRYGLILGSIEAYTQNIAVGTIVDPISAHKQNPQIYKIPKNPQIYKILCKLPIHRPRAAIMLITTSSSKSQAITA